MIAISSATGFIRCGISDHSLSGTKTNCFCFRVKQQHFVGDRDQRLVVVSHNDARSLMRVVRCTNQLCHLTAAGGI